MAVGVRIRCRTGFVKPEYNEAQRQGESRELIAEPVTLHLLVPCSLSSI